MENKKTNPYLGVLMLVPSLVLIAFVILWWMDTNPWIMVLLSLLAFTALIALIVLMVKSRKMENIWQKLVIGFGVFNILFFIIFFLFRNSYPEKMANHYEKHKTEINELCDYFVNAIEDSCYVNVEFNENGLMKLSVIPAGADYSIDYDKNKDLYSFLSIVGVDKDECDKIHMMLNNIGCIGISYNNKYDKIDLAWKYIGWNLLSYAIYIHPMTDAEKDMAMKYGIPYSDHVVFHNYGGAIGYLDFPDKERDKFLKKHQPW